jgi:hypothetical protein
MSKQSHEEKTDETAGSDTPSCGNPDCRFAVYEWHDLACRRIPGKPHATDFADRVLNPHQHRN